MSISEIFSRKSFKLGAFVAGFIFSVFIFYLDFTYFPNEITLLLPYILVIYVSTLLIGNKSGLFFSSLSLVFWFISNTKLFSNLSPIVFVNLAIKATFILLIFYLVRYNRKLYAEVKSLSLHDELTGLSNRRGFFTLASYEMKRMERAGNFFAMLFLDIDNFKLVNDTKGHKEGDRILRELGDIIRRTTRVVDIPSRFGGDEFCVLLPNTDRKNIEEIAKRISKDFSDRSETQAWGTTLSVGAYSSDAEYGLDEIIKKADALMYKAKGSGKNRIEFGGHCHG